MISVIKTSFTRISDAIFSLREKGGHEKEALFWINKCIEFGTSFLVNLFFDRILVYQHIVISEDSKPEDKRNKEKRRKALANMEAATLFVAKYVKENKLKEWESRVYRFLGRLYDYKGEFSNAIESYKKSASLAHIDPEVKEKGYPRDLEIQGFLSSSLIMNGNFKEGADLASKTYKEFNESKKGLDLKRNDYYTWAVWKSGIAIRTLEAINHKKVNINKEEILSWLDESDRDLNIGGYIKQSNNFNIRKSEILALRRRLQEEN